MPDQQTGNELITIDLISKAGIEAGMHIGDLGCGNLGFITIPAAKAVGKDGVVYAVDILKSVLEAVINKAKQGGLSNVKIIWSNLEIIGATRVPKMSLDVAFLVNMLFQSKKDDKVLQEAFRLLKSGGRLIIVDWKRIASPFGPPAEARPRAEDIKRFASDAGFRLEDEFEAGPYHYGLLLEK